MSIPEEKKNEISTSEEELKREKREITDETAKEVTGGRFTSDRNPYNPVPPSASIA